MADREVLDRPLRAAFRLAWFILGDRQAALSVTMAAMTRLDVVATAQDKRRYYLPVGRGVTRGVRTKVSLDELRLLQRLIYVESEPYEKPREGPNGQASEDDMLVHFIKHLVRITVKRNSFYVTLGVSRVLHTFTTGETMDLYDTVLQDPERARDDHYYRSRKARLMRELEDRFAGFLRRARGRHGEERFEATAPTQGRTHLAGRALAAFTPWDTPCPVPENVDPHATTIPALHFGGTLADEEHAIELNRFHAVLHPACYRRLVRSLKLDEPEHRLEIPRFVLSRMHDGESGGRHDRDRPPDLSEAELATIRGALAEQAARRRSAHGGLLRVLVDGVECARLDRAESTRAAFTVDEGAELVEVRTTEKGQDVLLACHVLTLDERRRSTAVSRFSVALEGGRALTITVALRADAPGASVEMSYQETLLRKAVQFFLQPTIRGHVPRLAWALVVLAIAGGIAFYVQSRRGNDGQPTQAGTEPATNRPAPPAREQRDARPPGSPREQGSAEEPGRMARLEPAERGEEPVTRSLPGERPVESLRAVKAIFVDPLGVDLVGHQLRDLVIAGLTSSGRFTVPATREEADAVLKGIVRSIPGAPGNSVSLTDLQLVNPRGLTLWPVNGKRYEGSRNDVSRLVIRDLVAAGDARRK